MAKRINKRKLNKIKTRLPEGWKDTLAKEFNLQPDTVRKVLLGLRHNPGVLTSAINMASLPVEEKEKLIEAIAS